MHLPASVILIVSAICGFAIAFYIWRTKKSGRKMICPLNFDCDAVVKSDYSKFFGVPVEILGIFYYGIIAASYSVFLAVPRLASSSVIFYVLALSVSAFLFSLYLIFIQSFSLRQFCSWCLMSSALSTIIFFAALSGSGLGFISLLEDNHSALLIAHGLGAALGFGGAVISDLFFFRFLKDFRISEWEAGILRALSQVIWFALGVLVVSGLGLYLPSADILNQTPKFLVKVIAVSVIIVNGAFLNLYIAPKLVKISFREKPDHAAGELHRARKLAFALGAVSIVSWCSAFVLGMLPRASSPGFAALLLIYFGLLAAGLKASQFVEKSFVRKATND